DVCPKCKGIFLDKEEIRKLTGDWSLNKLLTKYVGLDSDSQLVCPNCGGLMEIEDAGNVRVDACLDCKGVWLDAGELERLAAMDPAEFRTLTPEKIDELQKAKEIRHEASVVPQRSEEEPIEFRAEEWSVARRDEHSVPARDVESPAKAFDGSSAGLTINDEQGLGDNRPEDRDDRGNRHGYDNLSGQ